ncbi:hypothetical protein [Actinoplanes missouriensis]|uniref:hypothetical protein n=1 Tax=Actinoplanes missouriensis TaxID=1866 RepID=UPI0018D33F01|nr:hypothetical protein [Actinoplanes missouriensis]
MPGRTDERTSWELKVRSSAVVTNSGGFASMGAALGQVVAPSGAVVLACAGLLDEWSELGEPLSVRAMSTAGSGGACIRDWLAEAVAVPAGPGSLAITADTRAGAYRPIDTGDAIAVLNIDLGLPFSAVSAGSGPALLGDLPVDRCGTVIGDARALDSWVGFMHGDQGVDGLADIRIWGKGAQEAWEHFDAPRILTAPGDDSHGWLDLPVEIARERAAAINRWASAQDHYPHMAHVDLHSHHHLGWRAGWQHPLRAGVIEVAGCPILFIAWSPLELQRFTGGRSAGQVYPVTLEDVDGRATLRWTIPPHFQFDEQSL